MSKTLRPYRCPHDGCTFKPDCRWENLKRHLRRSGHCPELLVDGSPANRAYREKVKRESEEWARRNEGNPLAGAGRRTSRSRSVVGVGVGVGGLKGEGGKERERERDGAAKVG